MLPRDTRQEVPTRYGVNGQILLHGDGSSRSKILLNDDKLLLSFATFISPITRYSKNGLPVEVDEPFVNYFIMDKSRSQLFTLSNGPAAVISDMFGKLADAEMDSMNCDRD